VNLYFYTQDKSKLNQNNMKRMYKLFLGLVAIVAMSTLISCEGPAGPAGADGADGNLTCLGCHSQENWNGIETLYDLSGHKAAENVGYAGGRADCARCHSGGGFLDYLANTPDVEAADISYPVRISCETCHGNHGSLEDSIAAPIRTILAVTAIEDGSSLDFGGNSNLCANCHQSRRGADYYMALDSLNGEAVPAGMVAINSSHAGPHHGPQANTLLGKGGFGTSATHAHTTVGCVGCHMGEAGATEGGHSFKPNLANCTQCHEAKEFPNFDTRLAAIAEKLVEAGALGGDATEGYHPAVGIVTEAQFKAFWNYMYLYEDHSGGVHNPTYFNTLLTSAEANLGL